MINSLINKLFEENDIPNLSKDLDFSFLVLSSGDYRSQKTGRLVILVFQEKKLSFVIKFYKSNDKKIFQEYENQNSFHNIYPTLVSKPICCKNINGLNILIENPVTGKNFSKFFYEHLDKKSIKNSFKLLINFYETLNSINETSDFSNLMDEVNFTLDEFSKNYFLEKHEMIFIQECKSIFFKYFQEKNIFQRYSNNDFILKNFIISEHKLTMIDFEFLKKTSLYFFEWFQFFKYNELIHNDYIHDLLFSETQDQFFKSALQEFSKYKINDKFSISCRLIFEICEFEKRFSVCSLGAKQILKQDIKILIDDLKLRFKSHNEQNLISDVKTTEKIIFKIKHDNLIRPSNIPTINFLKHSIDEKTQVIKGLETSVKELSNQINEINKSKIWRFVQFILRH